MSSLKHTLYLPKTNFSMKADLIKKQENFWQLWKESEIYYKRLQQNKEKLNFIVIDGPPYANGNIHMGHALNKTLKDFIVRWKNISGYRCEIKLGWDMHGLPIEMQIEKENKNFRNLTIQEKIKKAKEYAENQIQKQSKQLDKLNLSFPGIPSYSTNHKEFLIKEYSIFQKLFEKGLITLEYKPVAWTCKSQTSLSESEIVYEEIDCESIYFTWEITSEIPNEFTGAKIILWTTTPYSLEANLAIAFKTEINYCYFQYQTNFYLSSYNFFKNIPSILDWKQEDLKFLSFIKADTLSSFEYLNNLTGEKNKFYKANFLVEEMGSGFVHLAPGLGKEDYLICKLHNIKPYCAINEHGVFNENTKFANINGQFYLDASKEVIKFLEENKQLLKIKKIKHRVGKSQRDNSLILYRTSRQWFLNLEKMKEKIESVFSSGIESNPHWLSEKLKEQLLSRVEWCISRQRYWGLPIPIIFEENTSGKIEPILDIQQIERNIKTIEKEGIEVWWDENKDISYFLDQKYQKSGCKYYKCKDVLDIWFDSGSVFYLNKEEFPADVYIEGSDQLRGWFNSSSILSLLIFDKLPFKNLVAHGFVLDKEGFKMSKSKGNVIDPVEVIMKYGADIFRLWVAKSNFLKDIKFSEDQMILIQSQYRKIRNILFKFSLSVLSDEIDWNLIRIKKIEEMKYIDNQLLYISFLWTLNYSQHKLNSFDFNKVIEKLLNFIDDSYSWYLELVKPILYSRNTKDEYKEEIIYLISIVLKYSLLLFSIFLPQTAEEVYQNIKFKNKKDSILLEDFDLDFEILQISELLENKERNKNIFTFLITNKKKILSFLKKECLNKGINSLREIKLFLPNKFLENDCKKIEKEEWKRILGVAEVEINNDLKIEKTINKPCERCLLYSYEFLREYEYENKNYQLCEICINTLKDQDIKKPS